MTPVHMGQSDGEPIETEEPTDEYGTHSHRIRKVRGK
jgi:hypothetical protein